MDRRPSLPSPAPVERLTAIREIRLAHELQAAGLLGSTVLGTDMKTPNRMMEASMPPPRRAKSMRSTDRSALSVDVILAFAVMLLTLWGIWELNSLLLH
jgi:hypothetical protein